MRLAATILFPLILSLPAATATAPKQEMLPQGKIAAMKQKPCTFLHVWATWCTICLEEMPDLVKTLGTLKQVNPVIIDMSSTFVQENFSKKWMATLKPSFTTYLKPKGKEEKYLNAIDKDWSGALPYTALYDKGQRKKVWVGSLDFNKVKEAIAQVCK